MNFNISQCLCNDWELEEHTWSLLHNTNLNRKSGSNSVHSCSLCKQEFVGLLKFTEHLREKNHQEKLLQWVRDQHPECSPEDKQVKSPNQQQENREMPNWATDDYNGFNYFSDNERNAKVNESWHRGSYPPGHPRKFYQHRQYHHDEGFYSRGIRRDEYPEVPSHPPWIGSGRGKPGEFRGDPPLNHGMINNLHQENDRFRWRRNSRDSQYENRAGNMYGQYPVGGRRPSHDEESDSYLRQDRQPHSHSGGSNNNYYYWHDSNSPNLNNVRDETMTAGASQKGKEEQASSSNGKYKQNSKFEPKETASSTQTKAGNRSEEGSFVDKTPTTLDHTPTSGSPVGKNARKGKPRKFARPGEEKKKDSEKAGAGSTTRDSTESKDTATESVPQEKILSCVGYKRGEAARNTETSKKPTWLQSVSTGEDPGSIEKDISKTATARLKGDSSAVVKRDTFSSEKGNSLSTQESNKKKKEDILKDIEKTKEQLLYGQKDDINVYSSERSKGHKEDTVSLADKKRPIVKGNSVSYLEETGPMKTAKYTRDSLPVTSEKRKEQQTTRLESLSVSSSVFQDEKSSNSKNQAENASQLRRPPETKNRQEFPHDSRNAGGKGETDESTYNVSRDIRPKRNHQASSPMTISNVSSLPWDKREEKLRSLLGVEKERNNSEGKETGLYSLSKPSKGSETRPSIPTSSSSSSPGSSKSPSSRYIPGFSQLSLSRPQCSFVHIDGVQCGAITWNKYCSYHQRVFKDEDSSSQDESTASLPSFKTKEDTRQSRSPKRVGNSKISKRATPSKVTSRNTQESKEKLLDAVHDPISRNASGNKKGSRDGSDENTGQIDLNLTSSFKSPRSTSQTDASPENIDLSSTVLRSSINPITDGTSSERTLSFIISAKAGSNTDVSVGATVDGNIRGSSGASIGPGTGASIDLSDTIRRPGTTTHHSDSLDREGSLSIDLSGTVPNLEGLLALHGSSVVETKASSNNNLSKTSLKDGRSWKHVDSSGIDNSLNAVRREKDRTSESATQLRPALGSFDIKEAPTPNPPLLIKVKTEPGTENEIAAGSQKTEMIDLNFSTKLLGVPHSVVAPFNTRMPLAKKSTGEVMKSPNDFSPQSSMLSSPRSPVISRNFSSASPVPGEQSPGSTTSFPSLSLDLSRFNLPPAVRKALADRYNNGRKLVGATHSLECDLPEGRRSQPPLSEIKTQEVFDPSLKAKASLPARLRNRGQRSISLDSTMVRTRKFGEDSRAGLLGEENMLDSQQSLNRRLNDSRRESTEFYSDKAFATSAASPFFLQGTSLKGPPFGVTTSKAPHIGGPKEERPDELQSQGLIDLSSTSYLDGMQIGRSTKASLLTLGSSQSPSGQSVLQGEGLIDLNTTIEYGSKENSEVGSVIKRKRLNSSLDSESASSVRDKNMAKRLKQQETSTGDDKTAAYRTEVNVQELLSIEREEQNQLQNLHAVQSRLTSVRAQIQKLCTELDSLSSEEQRITLRMGELRNARLNILENACYDRQGQSSLSRSDRISTNNTNLSTKQDTSNDSRMSATPVESVSQDGTFCNVVSRASSNSCEGSKDITPLPTERGFHGQSSLNASMTDTINQSGEHLCNIGKTSQISLREETSQSNHPSDALEFATNPGKCSFGENRQANVALQTSGSHNSDVVETKDELRSFGSRSERSHFSGGVVSRKPRESVQAKKPSKFCNEQPRRDFRKKSKHLTPSDGALLRKKSFSDVDVSKTIETGRKKIRSVKENMKRWKEQQEGIEGAAEQQRSGFHSSSHSDAAETKIERRASQSSRISIRDKPSPRRTSKDFKKSSMFHSAKRRLLESRKHRVEKSHARDKERNDMEAVPRKKRKVDNTSGDTEWSEMTSYKGKGGVICAAAHTTTAHLGGSGSEDMANMLDEIPTRDVESQSQSDDATSSINTRPNHLQIPSSTVNSLQKTLQKAKEHKRQGRQANKYEGHTGAVCGLKVHNSHLFTCSADKTTRAFDVQTGECIKVYQGHHLAVNCVEISEDKDRLFTGSNDQSVRSYNIKTGACTYKFTFDGRVMCLHAAFGVLFVGLNTGVVASIDLVANKLLERLPCHEPRGVSCLTAATEGQRRLLCCGSFDSTISIRDYKTGLLIRSISDHSMTVLCLQVVDDILYSGSADMKVQAHNLNTGDLLRSFDGHTASVSGLQVVGRVLVTSCLDKLIRCYDVTSGDLLQVYGGQMDMIFSVLVSNGRIFSGGRDGSVVAVKLDLRVYHPCKWQNCSLNFGIASHLRDHIKEYHVIEQGTVGACHWFQCGHQFSAEDDISVVLKHVLGHVVTRTARKTAI